ncbi:MAG: hypothetical protein M1830_001409 [Pleopsidium flavum]|nr:MAG: hypothetical protein M1830_001409 [Pleopsidium flavum]
MNLRTLDRLGHQLKLAFVDACRVNTIPEHLPALLKSYLGVIRDHGTDAPIIGGEALRWIETQGTEAWREAYECNPKPELVDEIMKVAMEHLRIVSFYDASEDLHPVVEPAPISIAEVSKPIAQPHKSLSRWAQAIPSIQMSKPTPVVETAPISIAEVSKPIAQPHKSLSHWAQAIPSIQMSKPTPVVETAPISIAEVSKPIAQPHKSLSRWAQAIPSIQMSKPTPVVETAPISVAEVSSPPSQWIQTPKTLIPAPFSVTEVSSPPSQWIQTSETLNTAVEPINVSTAEGLNQPSQSIQLSKTLTPAMEPAPFSNAEGSNQPSQSIQLSKTLTPAMEPAPFSNAEGSNQPSQSIQLSKTLTPEVETNTITPSEASKQLSEQPHRLMSRWRQAMEPAPFSNAEGLNKPTQSIQVSKTLTPEVETNTITPSEASKQLSEQPHRLMSRWRQAMEPAPFSNAEGLNKPTQSIQVSKTLTPEVETNTITPSEASKQLSEQPHRLMSRWRQAMPAAKPYKTKDRLEEGFQNRVAMAVASVVKVTKSEPPALREHRSDGFKRIPIEIWERIIISLAPWSRINLSGVSKNFFNAVHRITGVLRTVHDHDEEFRTGLYMHQFDEESGSMLTNAVAPASSKLRPLSILIFEAETQPWTHEVQHDTRLFVEGLEALTKHCLPAAVKRVEFHRLTYFTLRMLLQTHLSDYPNLEYAILSRLPLITLDRFFEPATQRQIEELPFQVEYDFPEPDVGEWKTLDKAGALAGFAYHWRHNILVHKTSVPYLIYLFQERTPFRDHFLRLMNKWGKEIVTPEIVLRFLSQKDDSEFKKSVFQATSPYNIKLDPNSNWAKYFRCEYCRLLGPGICFARAQFNADQPKCLKCRWEEIEVHWISGSSPTKQIGERARAAEELLEPTDQTLTAIHERYLSKIRGSNYRPLVEAAPDFPDQVIGKPAFMNNQVSHPEYMIQQQRKESIVEVSEAETTLITFPSHLNQEYAKICPRSIAGQTCLHRSSCSLLSCYNKNYEGDAKMHPFIKPSCGSYMRGGECPKGVNCLFVHKDLFEEERKFLDGQARRKLHDQKNI